MTDNGAIAPGTVCYLVKLTERAEFVGRIATVVAGPLHADGVGDWYEISSSWLRELFQGYATHVRRRSLKPITPPPLAAPAPPITEEIPS